MKPEEINVRSNDPLAARRGEGMVLIVQNNAEKTLSILSMNDVLETMLGYAKGEMLRRPLASILGKKEAALLAEDMEYDDNASDFGDIFSRIREVKLRRRTGDEIRVTCTLSRLMAQDGNACFQLVIPNEAERVAADKLNEFIALNLDGRTELDHATGLPNQKTAQEFLPVLKNYFSHSEANIVVALVRMDRYEKSVARYGSEACRQLLKHVYQCCQSSFRSKDLIFALSENMLALVLFDISRESARVVLNRLRWKIRNHRIDFGGKSDFSFSACIGFDVLDLEHAEGALARYEAAMSALEANERNALIEFSPA